MKYLKKSAGYVVLIIALLFLQAYCDLSLPDYTSKIVNVGIQQSGIEDSVPEKIRKKLNRWFLLIWSSITLSRSIISAAKTLLTST